MKSVEKSVEESVDVRRQFLRFFENRKHKIVHSSPLIPKGDASLLFTSAGMVPFKPYFLGLKKDLETAASCQKCFRTTDIDEVGHTARHLTFFEMLGNFSFGGYFKKESLLWGWEFLTKTLKLSPERLYITVYGGGKAPEDKESLKIWQEILPKNLHSHITKLGDKDNFWQMADTGPCGPCSEIYYDFHPKGNIHKNCSGPGCDCDRFIEIWNHVFTEFDMQSDGSLKPLPTKNIDTGMGLERVTAAVEGKQNPFETDLFYPIIETAEKVLGLDYKNEKHKTALQVIADHLRSAAFLISEGVLPSNEGRGYVLRRLIRRAVRYGHLHGKKKVFLNELVEPVSDIFADNYPEIKQNYKHIKDIITAEEERFLKTLSDGEEYLKSLIKDTTKKISGKDAFFIYETYGFPFELVKEIALAKNIEVDEKGFNESRENARNISKESKGKTKQSTFNFQALDGKFPPTVFVGYESLSIETKILAILDNSAKEVNILDENAEGYILLEKTPFYAESGGQVGDTGMITDDKGNILAEVQDTQKYTDSLIFHKVKTQTKIKKDSFIEAVVDIDKRKAVTQNHTATHLLNAALKSVLGSSVSQAGSYVSSERFRFDYTAQKVPSKQQIEEITKFMNTVILSGLKVSVSLRPLKDAQKLGAVTLIGEKYVDPARFVLINDGSWDNTKDRVSLELCGGTHIQNTADIVGVKILRDSALSSGVRRMEGVAGKSFLSYLDKISIAAEKTSLLLAVAPSDMYKRTKQLLDNEEKLKKEIDMLKQKLLSGESDSVNTVKISGDLELVWSKTENANISHLRTQADNLKAKHKNAVIFLVSENEDKISFILTVGGGLKNESFNCGEISKKIASEIEGSAGGRNDFAQGGGKIPKNWNKFISSVSKTIKSSF